MQDLFGIQNPCYLSQKTRDIKRQRGGNIFERGNRYPPPYWASEFKSFNIISQYGLICLYSIIVDHPNYRRNCTDTELRIDEKCLRYKVNSTCVEGCSPDWDKEFKRCQERK